MRQIANPWFEDFQKWKAKDCTALSHIEFSDVESFLPRIPTPFEQIEFLQALKHLPNDRNENGIRESPTLSNRNDYLYNQIAKKLKAIVENYFDLMAIMADEEKIDDNETAIRFLYDIQRQYLKTPDHLKGDRFRISNFEKAIERLIQRRKDLRNTQMQGRISIIGDGNVVGNQNENSTTKTTVIAGATLADFAALLSELRGELNAAQFDEDIKQILESDLDVVEGQIVKEKPNKSIIQAKLASMAAMAKDAATIGAAATGLVPLIHKAIEMVQHLK